MTTTRRVDTPEQFYDELHKASVTWYRGQPPDAMHPPILVALLDNGSLVEPIPLAPLFEDGRGKDLAAALHRIAASKAGVRCAAMITEAWMSGHLTREQAQVAQVTGLSEYPGREECVMFNLLTDDRQAMMMCRLDRKSEGIIEAVPFKWTSDATGKWDGRMVRS